MSRPRTRRRIRSRPTGGTSPEGIARARPSSRSPMARGRTCPPAPTGRRQPVATRWFPRTRSIHSITLLQFRVWARRSAGSDPPLSPDGASRLHRGLVALATAFVLLPQEAPAHDPDTLGGVFRTHDAGATWASINPGIFVSGALALAVSPRAPNHLLLATDSGLWRSRNGGGGLGRAGAGRLHGPGFPAAVASHRPPRAGGRWSSLLPRDGGALGTRVHAPCP